MKKNTTIGLLIFILSSVATADCGHNSLRCMNTTLGHLEQITATEAKDGHSHLILNGKEIYKSTDGYIVVDNDDGIIKNKKYLITKATLSYIADQKCNENGARCTMYAVLDLTSGKPAISNWFFTDYGGSHITWVSWGKANAIIVIDNYLRFKYANGHVEKVTKEKDAAGENDAKK